MAGRTAVESLKKVPSELEGFDTEGVGVKRAPAVTGRLDLEMSPPQVSAGEPYVVKMFLLNEGDRIIWVDKMSVSMIVDGKPSARPMPSKTRAIRPRERGLLEELPGVWKGGVRSWAVEVVVTSKDHDVYRNRLSWQE